MNVPTMEQLGFLNLVSFETDDPVVVRIAAIEAFWVQPYVKTTATAIRLAGTTIEVSSSFDEATQAIRGYYEPFAVRPSDEAGP